jgi:hypothetical protein
VLDIRYSEVNKNERFKFELRDYVVKVTVERRIAGNWQLVRDAAIYRKEFDRATYHAKHFSNFISKFVRDPEYRQEWRLEADHPMLWVGWPSSPPAEPAGQAGSLQPAMAASACSQPARAEVIEAEVVAPQQDLDLSTGSRLSPVIQEDKQTKEVNAMQHQESTTTVNVKLYGESGGDILLTLREGASLEGARALIDTLAEVLKYAREKYHLSPSLPSPPLNVPLNPAPSMSGPVVGNSQTGNPTTPLPAGWPQVMPPPLAGSPSPGHHYVTPAPAAAVAAAASPAAVLPPLAQPAGSGVDLSFMADSLTVGMDESANVVTKVRGGKFTQYGLRVWPEVLETAGFNPAALVPGQKYSLQGWIATYCLGDNSKPLKVTQLQRAA